MKRKKLENREALVKTILLLLMFVTAYFIIKGGRRLVSSVSSGGVETSKDRPCVVIDAGHGGGR